MDEFVKLIIEIYEMYYLHTGNKELSKQWMITPHPDLDNTSPVNLILQKQASRVVEYINAQKMNIPEPSRIITI